MKFGSLFSGIGGIDLGLERAGMECAWQVENDEYCLKVLAKHWPNVTRYKDIREVDFGGVERVDLLAGGFPCQDLSYAGKGAGLSGSRSGLWSEFARSIRMVRPRYVLVENVPGLLGRGMGIVLADLSSLGYDAEWESIPAAAFGAPHLRWRVFVIAYAACGGRGTRGAWRPDCVPKRVSTAKAIQDLAHSHGSGCKEQRRHKPVSEELATIECGGENVAHSELSRLQGCPRGRCTREGRSPSVFASDGKRPGGEWPTEPNVGRVADGVPRRVDRLRGLGNAVVPQVTQYIGEQLMMHLGDEAA